MKTVNIVQIVTEKTLIFHISITSSSLDPYACPSLALLLILNVALHIILVSYITAYPLISGTTLNIPLKRNTKDIPAPHNCRHILKYQ